MTCEIEILRAGDVASNPATGKHVPRRAVLDAIVDVSNACEELYGTYEGERIRRGLLKIPVTYNARLRRALGRTRVMRERGHHTVLGIELRGGRFSFPEGTLHKVLVHEFAHAARVINNPEGYGAEQHHGWQWQALMRAAGGDPSADMEHPEFTRERVIDRERRRAKREGRAPRDVSAMAKQTSADFNLGDTVSWYYAKRGSKEQRWTGEILRKDARRAVVRDRTGGQWGIPYASLEHADDAPFGLDLPARSNPSEPSRRAIKLFEDFHQFEPRRVGTFGGGFHIPRRATLVGPAVHVMYRSDKLNPTTGEDEGEIDYIHDHKAGVNVYWCTRDAGGPDRAVPKHIYSVDTLVRLGECLGLAWEDDDGDAVEAKVTTPRPTLYATPSGKALLLVHRSRVVAMVWGGKLGVEARGIIN